MRIDSNPAAQALPESGRAGNPNSASAGTSSTANPALGEDQAELSGGHIQIQALATQALQFPEVRQEKVNALRQVVLSGGYQVNAEQVAGAMFEEMLVKPAA